MKNLYSILLGMLFGGILVKAEVLSWFRIQEMFWFQGFHMYGVIGSAVAVGAVSLWLLKRFNAKSISGDLISPAPKTFNKKGNLIGGIIFGFGWALTGACPGPLYALIGSGYGVILISVLAAMFGVVVYGRLKDRLPH
ncbi:MAG: transporter [Bacteroidetes bacterium]|nr:MAG: transporter [Bacteroidota bacterium]